MANDTIGGTRVELAPLGRVKRVSWWDAEAKRLEGLECPKCHNPCTRGVYVSPFVLEDNAVARECGVVNNCLLCGTETVYRRGVDGIPVAETRRTPPPAKRRLVKLPWANGRNGHHAEL